MLIIMFVTLFLNFYCFSLFMLSFHIFRFFHILFISIIFNSIYAVCEYVVKHVVQPRDSLSTEEFFSWEDFLKTLYTQ